MSGSWGWASLRVAWRTADASTPFSTPHCSSFFPQASNISGSPCNPPPQVCFPSSQDLWVWLQREWKWSLSTDSYKQERRPTTHQGGTEKEGQWNTQTSGSRQGSNGDPRYLTPSPQQAPTEQGFELEHGLWRQISELSSQALIPAQLLTGMDHMMETLLTWSQVPTKAGLRLSPPSCQLHPTPQTATRWSGKSGAAVCSRLFYRQGPSYCRWSEEIR